MLDDNFGGSARVDISKIDPYFLATHILNSSIKSTRLGTTQSAPDFIFGKYVNGFSQEEKRLFLIVLEAMLRTGQARVKHVELVQGSQEYADEAGPEEIALQAFCKLGLLKPVGETPTAEYEITDHGGILFSNYSILRDIVAGGGRMRIEPDFSYRKEIFYVRTGTENFLNLLKSNARRSFEDRMGELAKLTQSKNPTSDGNVRLLLLYQTDSLYIDPAMSFEIILVDPVPKSRLKIIASCYHTMAESAFEEILREIYGTWPEDYETIPPDTKELGDVKGPKITILLLSADPSNAARLRLGEEYREIQEKLQLSKHRDSLELHQRTSVRPADISQALLDINPHIVHFSGHGMRDGELCFEDVSGKTLPIEPDAWASLFEQFSDRVSCVILNACYSAIQAKAIGQHINYVIGMSEAIGDKAAIAYSVGFYQALGAQRSIEEAHKLGCTQIQLQGIDEQLTPVLIHR